MATLDWRTKDEKHRGGSDLLYLGLTAAQLDALLSTTGSTDSWILISYLKDTGNSIGEEYDTAVEFSEGGVRDQVTNRHEGVLNVTFQQTSKRVLDLVKFVQTNTVTAKRLLPLRVAGGGGETHQLWGSERFTFDIQSYSIGSDRNATRELSAVGRAVKADPNDTTEQPWVIEEVDVTDETGWPASADPFKETAFGA